VVPPGHARKPNPRKENDVNIKGTKTLDNLKYAFAGESQANRR
jgi:hypothetical protein